MPWFSFRFFRTQFFLKCYCVIKCCINCLKMEKSSIFGPLLLNFHLLMRYEFKKQFQWWKYACNIGQVSYFIWKCFLRVAWNFDVLHLKLCLFQNLYTHIYMYVCVCVFKNDFSFIYFFNTHIYKFIMITLEIMNRPIFLTWTMH